MEQGTKKDARALFSSLCLSVTVDELGPLVLTLGALGRWRGMSESSVAVRFAKIRVRNRPGVDMRPGCTEVEERFSSPQPLR